MKKTYLTPKVIVRGTVEQITQGQSWGISDFFFGDGGTAGTVTGTGSLKGEYCAFRPEDCSS